MHKFPGKIKETGLRRFLFRVDLGRLLQKSFAREGIGGQIGRGFSLDVRFGFMEQTPVSAVGRFELVGAVRQAVTSPACTSAAVKLDDRHLIDLNAVTSLQQLHRSAVEA